MHKINMFDLEAEHLKALSNSGKKSIESTEIRLWIHTCTYSLQQTLNKKKSSTK